MIHEGMMKPGEHGPSIEMLDGDDYVGLCSQQSSPSCLRSTPTKAGSKSVTAGSQSVLTTVEQTTYNNMHPNSSEVLPVIGRGDRFVDDLTV